MVDKRSIAVYQKTNIHNKKTATCIGLSAIKFLKKDKDAVMLVLPSDHFIQQESLFVETLQQAVQIAEKRRGLITIGVNPIRPETGYGYIQMGNRVAADIPTFKVARFTEKPNLEVAKDFLIDGNYLWNSGMFAWRADGLSTKVRRCVYSVNTRIFKHFKSFYILFTSLKNILLLCK